MESVIEKLIDLSTPVVEGLGYELYHLEFVTEEGEDYLRYYIESPDQKTIDLKDCERVSRKLSDLLDEADPIESAYILEVSSPGLFRQLFTPDHQKKAIGETVRVRLAEGEDLLGELVDRQGDGIRLKTGQTEVEVKDQAMTGIFLEPNI